MSPYQHIVIGVNYTEACRSTLWQAHCLAKASNAKLHAIHVVPSSHMEDFLSFYELDHARMINSARLSLEAFLEEVIGPDHGITSSISEGSPHHEVVSFANENSCDLLVLGTDEYARKPRRSGQFAIRCLRFAKMPVLIVRNQPERPFAKLSACIDLSTATQDVLKHAARVDHDQDQAIRIVHAHTPPWLRPPHLRYQTETYENKEIKEQYHEILNGQLAGLTPSAAELFQSPPEIVQLEHEDTDFALLDYLKTSNTELAILGRWGRGLKSLKNDLLGGTAETIIRHAHCSVLIVPIIT